MRTNEDLARTARLVFDAGVAAVDPYVAVSQALSCDGDRLLVRLAGLASREVDLAAFSRIVVVGAGKASARMALAVEEMLGDRLQEGLVVVKYGHGAPTQHTRVREAGHPVPDEAGLAATREMLDLVDTLDKASLLFVLLSGGGSALMPQPAGQIRLVEKQEVTRRLLAAGADIGEMNAVRKHLSAVKGGRLAQRALPATLINLMLSDVVGDHLEVIASGPSVPDPSTFADARRVLERYQLWNEVPKTVRAHIVGGLGGTVEESPKAGDPAFARCTSVLVGGNRIALEACRSTAEQHGWNVLLLSSTIEGETRDIARMHAAIAREIRRTGHPIPPPACLISGGETTVTLRGHGKGGRNQEFALAAALDLAGETGIAIFSAGTDGTDGPTDAAGGIAFGDSVARAAAAGMSLRRHLEQNDAYRALEAIGDLVLTGPTGTNVMDVHLVLVSA